MGVVTINKHYIDACTVNILNIRHLGANMCAKLDMTASLDFTLSTIKN